MTRSAAVLASGFLLLVVEFLPGCSAPKSCVDAELVFHEWLSRTSLEKSVGRLNGAGDPLVVNDRNWMLLDAKFSPLIPGAVLYSATYGATNLESLDSAAPRVILASTPDGKSYVCRGYHDVSRVFHQFGVSISSVEHALRYLSFVSCFGRGVYGGGEFHPFAVSHEVAPYVIEADPGSSDSALVAAEVEEGDETLVAKERLDGILLQLRWDSMRWASGEDASVLMDPGWQIHLFAEPDRIRHPILYERLQGDGFVFSLLEGYTEELLPNGLLTDIYQTNYLVTKTGMIYVLSRRELASSPEDVGQFVVRQKGTFVFSAPVDQNAKILR